MSFEVATVTISRTAFLICLGLTFTLGTFCGYQLKTWRLEWLKRKRDRLISLALDFGGMCKHRLYGFLFNPSIAYEFGFKQAKDENSTDIFIFELDLGKKANC
ncbi:hypothetical protein Anas_04337 [Armadillidium nasatum]|uniref:Uncharacterized protein n=1 Tax=Armadillidium nasatum TaxID=96803 RepID=A0A5N5T0L0_9CRUS|nr:hypothetical protein Anas_04337 [Armadillidium nasatum]